jgi:hypothetical protein
MQEEASEWFAALVNLYHNKNGLENRVIKVGGWMGGRTGNRRIKDRRAE